DDTEIPYPSIKQQVEIANVLDKAAFIIEARKKELDELDNLIKARFVELFGDRFINDRNWDTKKLSECMSFNNGKAHEQVVDENGEYILITSRAIASDLKDVRRTNALLFPLHKNDIVMVMSDVPNGRALAKCLLIDSDEKYTLNQRICSFANYNFNPIFLVNLLSRHQYFLDFNDGNGQTNLRKNDILECELIIPPMEMQEQFADFVIQVDKSKFAVQKALDEAQLLFESLMQKYFG
ncbi:MAG: restriction endonuclease subunit S, partial [Lachnospiraceae bacterium]|nr:restriction endonuclease subunit S [Lachnospiraceae bacterium]